MNNYIRLQLSNMELYLNTFIKSCELAATKDDGMIDKQEQKELHKIKQAVERFKKDLKSV